MTYSKELIVKVLHIYVEGLSLSEIRDYIYQYEGYIIYDGTILYRIVKYTNMLEEFERKQKPRSEGRIHMDEVEVKAMEKKHGASMQ